MDVGGPLIVFGVIVLLALIVAFSSLRIANEYERGVVFRLGRLIPLKGPGLFFIIPFGVDRLVKIDLRTITLEVPPQEIITSDNVTAKVNAVIYFQVVDAQRAVVQVLNFINATSQIAQTTLRATLGQSTLDELLGEREKINLTLQKIIDETTEPWGIKVAVVEIKDVELPTTMQRAMAKQAEAEREKRAKIINADGEFQAAQTLDAGRDRRGEEHDHRPADPDRAHRADPGREGQVDRRGDAGRTGQAPAARAQVGLTGNLFLDASDAVVLLTPLPMIIAANSSVGRSWEAHASGILCGLLAGSLFLFGAIDFASAGSGVHNPPAVDIAVMITALAAAAVASKPVRDFAARLIPIDPSNPVHALALALAVILLGTQVAAIAFTDVLTSELKAPALTVPDLFWQEVPFLVLGLAGIGLWIRRDARAAATRVGAVVPQWWQLALAVSAAGVFFAFSLGSDRLSHLLTPALANQVDKTTAHLFGGLTSDPVALILLALVPGVCEELLFPVLFTAIHTQYGVSLDAPTILIIALGLGVIRKYTNTTTSCTCHVAYNLLTGFGLSGVYQQVAIGIEVVLIAAVAYALWSRRRPAEAVEVPEEVAVR